MQTYGHTGDSFTGVSVYARVCEGVCSSVRRCVQGCALACNCTEYTGIQYVYHHSYSEFMDVRVYTGYWFPIIIKDNSNNNNNNNTTNNNHIWTNTQDSGALNHVFGC